MLDNDPQKSKARTELMYGDSAAKAQTEFIPIVAARTDVSGQPGKPPEMVLQFELPDGSLTPCYSFSVETARAIQSTMLRVLPLSTALDTMAKNTPGGR